MTLCATAAMPELNVGVEARAQQRQGIELPRHAFENKWRIGC